MRIFAKASVVVVAATALLTFLGTAGMAARNFRIGATFGFIVFLGLVILLVMMVRRRIG